MISKLIQIKSLYLFIFIGLFCCNSAIGADIKYCDSLIRSGIDVMWKKNHVKSLELLTEARTLAEKNRWHKQMFLAQNNIGCNYYMMLDYGEALKQYLESYKIAIKYLDTAHEMTVLNNIAILYSKEKKFRKANDYFLKAYRIAKKNNDSIKIGLYSLNLGSLANEENRLQEARNYLDQSLRYTQHPQVSIPAQITLCVNDLLLGHPQKARLSAEKLFYNLKNEENNDNRLLLSSIIAKTYLKENNLVSALQWTNNTLSEKPDLENKRELFGLLADIYFRLKTYNLAFQYKDSINAADNKLNVIKNGKLFESSEVKFQIQNYKKEISEKESKIKNERKIFYSILASIIFGIIILLVVFRNHLIKNKQSRLIAQRDKEIIEFKLQKETACNSLLIEKEKTALLEQERLKKEIELRNQKISSKSLYLSGRNQLLEEILKSLSKAPELSENRVLINDVKALKAHLKIDDDWDDFIRHFEEVNQGFIKNLTAKHPQLTTTDIRYISYVYMNLNTKEIATMLNITLEACRKRKERIEKRMNLPDHLSLSSYISIV